MHAYELNGVSHSLPFIAAHFAQRGWQSEDIARSLLSCHFSGECIDDAASEFWNDNQDLCDSIHDNIRKIGFNNADDMYDWTVIFMNEHHDQHGHFAPADSASSVPASTTEPTSQSTPTAASATPVARTPVAYTLTSQEAFDKMKDFQRSGWSKPTKGQGGFPQCKMSNNMFTIYPHGNGPGKFSSYYVVSQSIDGGQRGTMLPKVFTKINGAATYAEARYKMMVDQGMLPKPTESTPEMHEMYQRATQKQLANVGTIDPAKPRLPNGLEIPAGHSACTRCSGYGKIPSYGHVAEGTCFKCEGSGLMKVSVKTEAAKAKAAAKIAEKQAQTAAGLAENSRKQAKCNERYAGDPRLAVGPTHAYYDTHTRELAQKDGVWNTL